jgi:carbon monoxide dehydrogenase subunit G
MRIQRDYLLEAPLNDVWSFIRSSEHVARCLPGAKLGNHLGDESYNGSIAFKVGPKVVTFFGTATFAYDDSARYGTIDAVGADRRETSRAKAQIEFSVNGGPSESESSVALRGDISFAGALAQFASEGGVYVGEELLDQFGRRLAEELRAGKDTGDASTPEAPGLAEGTAAAAPPVKVGGRLQLRVALGLFKAAMARLARFGRRPRWAPSDETETSKVGEASR